MQNGTASWENNLPLIMKLTTDSRHNPEIPFLGFDPWEIKTRSHKDLKMNIYHIIIYNNPNYWNNPNTNHLINE